jgi:hypothetical protein
MPKQYDQEKSILFVGTLFSSSAVFDSALKILNEQFGSILLESNPMPWNFSHYYDKELGTPIYRIFIFFDRLIDPSSLVNAKLITNEIETNLSKENKRLINLDPGYLTTAKIVLASTKNYSHRIYLGKGIFGEVALLYKNKRFNPLPYTYSDYRDDAFLSIFMKARSLLTQIMY